MTVIERLSQLWRKFPVILRSALLGFIVLIAGILPWSQLVEANLKIGSTFPWAFFVALVYLVFYWKYFSGWGWPESTAPLRRRLFRANAVRGRILLWSGIAGGLLSCTLVSLQVLAWLLGSTSKVEEFTILHSYSFWTVLPMLLMGSVVAGVVEEAAFRGYMQVPIEDFHGPRTAIVVVAILFSLPHFPSLLAMPVFFLAATAWGALAYFSDSVLPGMVFHAAIDAVTWIWVWQNIDFVQHLISTEPSNAKNDALIFVSGGTFLLATVTFLAFLRLAKVASAKQAFRS